MEFLELASERYSVRKFKDTPVHPMEYAADEAKPAPSHTQYRNLDEIVCYK